VLKPVKKPTAAPEPVVAGKGQIYTVQPKDNLGKIALKAYGDASKWQRIQDANADVLKGGVALKVGMKLKIP
jgi:nucleoid-associated protein YgaU